jgi:hypothetical protein
LLVENIKYETLGLENGLDALDVKEWELDLDVELSLPLRMQVTNTYWCLFGHSCKVIV